MSGDEDDEDDDDDTVSNRNNIDMDGTTSSEIRDLRHRKMELERRHRYQELHIQQVKVSFKTIRSQVILLAIVCMSRVVYSYVYSLKQ